VGWGDQVSRVDMGRGQSGWKVEEDRIGAGWRGVSGWCGKRWRGLPWIVETIRAARPRTDRARAGMSLWSAVGRFEQGWLAKSQRKEKGRAGETR
jgi:hypothetical protein